MWVFVLGGCAVVLLAATVHDAGLRSYLFDALGLMAAGGATVGVLVNRPAPRLPWQMVALALALFAAGDVLYDIVTRVGASTDGSPWADLLYVPGYLLLAGALASLGRRNLSRSVVIDATVVTFAVTTVIWKWALQPTLHATSGGSFDRALSVGYPILDVLLAAGVVLTLFSFARWKPAAWLVLTGITVILLGDVVYTRLLAEGTYTPGGTLDTSWPIGYFLLAGAVLHPSMHDLCAAADGGLGRRLRTRMVLLGFALLAAPVVVLLDSGDDRSRLAVGLAATAAAGLVAWRVSRLLTDSNRAREDVSASEARFRALVQHAADVIVVLGGDGRVRYVSPAVARVVGRADAELVGSPFAAWADVPPSWIGTLVERLEHADGRPLTEELRVRRELGAAWVEATWTDQRADPSVEGIVGNLRVVTERRKHEELAAAEQAVVEMILAGLSVPSTLHRLLEAVEAFLGDVACAVSLVDRETGQTDLAVAPSLPPALVDGMQAQLTLEELGRIARGPDLRVVESLERSGIRAALADPPRKHGFVGVWVAPVRTPDGSDLLGYFGVYTRAERVPTPAERKLVARARDLVAITIDRADRSRRLDHLALHDTLTGLPNRLLAIDRIDRAIARLGDTQGVVGLLFVDLDRFKRVNDVLGHERGDEVLVAAARRLTDSVRHEDTVARLGGDEFVVVCEHLDTEEQAEALARRIVAALAAPFRFERAEVNVAASVGIATTRRPDARADALLRDADAAMYRAKRRGGSRFERFDEAMQNQAVTRMLTERALRDAVERDELRIVFQPVVNLRTGAREGLEALLRWQHPVRGLVEPHDFLRVAEETGLMDPIGRWVLDEACRVTGVHSVRGPDGGRVPLSVNVSPRELQLPEFADAVAATLDAHAVDPGQLTLEVSERALLDDSDAFSGTLRDLKALGVRLAIDDFGTAGSSLAHLRRFAFDELKIDRTFTAAVGASSTDDAIIAANVDLAHALGMLVTAEGVETAEQQELLRQLGCDRGQGYALGAPAELGSRTYAILPAPD